MSGVDRSPQGIAGRMVDFPQQWDTLIREGIWMIVARTYNSGNVRPTEGDRDDPRC